MRTLSGTLLTAQKSPTTTPYVKVEVTNKIGAATRLDWERLYAGSEGDYFHALTIPGDGSLNRFRGDPSTHLVYRQRVANPGPSSDYSQWTSTGATGTAIAACSQGSEVLLFRIADSSPWHIWRLESSDYGATWGSWIDTGLVSDADGRVAAAQKSNGDVCILYTRGATLYSCKRTSGFWGAEAAWTNSLNSITGIAVVHYGDWNFIVTGTDTNDKKGVWRCILGDGSYIGVDIWTALEEIMLAASDSDIEYKLPFITRADNLYRLFFLEAHTATQAYSRPYFSHSLPTQAFVSNIWREPVPFNLDSDYGLAIDEDGTYAWLTAPYGVWRALLSPSTTNLTDDVLDIKQVILPERGNLMVELRNDQGQYSDFDKLGCEILVSPGYKTTAGEEYSSGPSFWIEGWEYISQAAQSILRIYAIDTWGLLSNWTARRQLQWEQGDKLVVQILSFIFGRISIRLSTLSSSNIIDSLQPAFTINPGESGATAVRRLLDKIPDVLLFRYFNGNINAYVKNPRATDSTDYTYGTDHLTFEGRYRSSAWAPNRAQLYGDTVIVDRFGWDQIEDVYDRLQQINDINIATESHAEQSADARLREAEIEATAAEILVPMNCGQELWDVVEINDARIGLESQKYRVVGFELTYSTKKPLYRLKIDLGAV